MQSRVRLEDIAAACGVTKGLVSRALAGKYNVSDETKNKIVQKAAELGYDTTHLRSRPATISRVLLVISSRLMLKEDYWQPIIKSIAHTLDLSSIVLEYFVYEEGKIDEESLEKLSSSKCNAFVVIHANPETINAVLAKTGKPIVEVDPKFFRSEDVTQVKFSNYDSMYLATQDLVDKGHQKIAFYGSDSHATSFRERHEGFLACVEANKGKGVVGISVNFDNANLYYCDDALFEKILLEEKPTAVVCANDIIALNAYRIIEKVGLRIPEDVSVIGFDNIRDGDSAHPRLSTFNVPREELGKEVANYLIGMFSEKQLQFSAIVIRCAYVMKDSVRKLN
jgi:LacI family transcriptional regulator